jgi:hypothetical protein
MPELDLFVELKTTSSMKDIWIERNGRNQKVPWYHPHWLDMAIYWDACRQNYGNMTGYLVGGLLSDNPAIRAYSFENKEEEFERYLEGVKVKTEEIKAWKNGEQEPPPCRKLSCDYCNSQLPLQVEPAVAWF